MGYARIGAMGHPIPTKKQKRIVIPEAAREYIKDCCGEDGLRLIEHTIYIGEWIILDGVPASGKTTIEIMLNRLGYPYVMTSTEGAYRVIHTLGRVDAEHLKPVDDILAELGID